LIDKIFQLINAEATVAQKLHQGTNRQTRCNRLAGSFLLLFGQAKRTMIIFKTYLFFFLDKKETPE